MYKASDMATYKSLTDGDKGRLIGLAAGVELARAVVMDGEGPVEDIAKYLNMPLAEFIVRVAVPSRMVLDFREASAKKPTPAKPAIERDEDDEDDEDI